MKPKRAPAVCRCGHGREAHVHYRAGSDCALCACPRWNPPNWLLRRFRERGDDGRLAPVSLTCRPSRCLRLGAGARQEKTPPGAVAQHGSWEQTAEHGSFSVVALVWRPGQATTIHDHVAWGAFAVLQGTEHEETFALAPDGSALRPLARNQNRAGDVSAFAPPGDIHRITNAGDDIVIQLHVYGTNVARLGTSIRRVYDLPLLPA